MSYTSDPADQIVRYSLEGAEVALKLSGLAAKNFAMFAYAVLQDHKKTRGKTRLVELLKRQKPLKFFTMPEDRMREFTKEAKRHGLLFVPMRDKSQPGVIEIAVLAQDAAKINRIMDRMCLDFVKAAAGEAVPEPPAEKDLPAPVEAPVQTETVETEQGAVDFVVGDFEDDFGIEKGDDGNFTQGPVDDPVMDQPGEPNPFEPSSPSSGSSQTRSDGDKAEEPDSFDFSSFDSLFPPTQSAGDKAEEPEPFEFFPPGRGTQQSRSEKDMTEPVREEKPPQPSRPSVIDELRAIQRDLKERAERIRRERARSALHRTRSRKKKTKGR